MDVEVVWVGVAGNEVVSGIGLPQPANQAKLITSVISTGNNFLELPYSLITGASLETRSH